VDMQRLIDRINPPNSGSTGFQNRWPNLDVAMHDRRDGYPTFMPQWGAPQKPEETYPENNEAAAEIAVGILKNGFNDFNRPGTYEIVNEPHWSVIGDQRFADLHTAIWQKTKDEGLSTLIGGPCQAVAYYYQRNYNSLNEITPFIDNTQSNLDFYSFHIYDFLEWDATKNDFRGRVTTGLPLEGVLDAVQNHTQNTFNKEVPIVISEHGGYLFRDAATEFVIPQTVADQLIGPGSGFNYEMQKRSIGCRIMTRSAISNTMTFMNNPHVIQKAVPFMLLQTANWNTRYYASLLVAENFQRGNPWVESELINFYKFFADIQGRRVFSYCEDPDIQYQTFLDGQDLYIVLNNLGEKAEMINFDLSKTDFTSVNLKRHGQNADFTPYFNEENPANLDNLTLQGREAMVIKLSYPGNIEPTKSIDVVPYYANKQKQVLSPGQSVDYQITVPEFDKTEHATLRIGVGRQTLGTDRDLKVIFNNTEIEVPMEDISEYLESASGYGSTKIIKIDPNLIQEVNTVTVSFTDTNVGGIGSVVLRVGLNTNVLSVNDVSGTTSKTIIYPNPLQSGKLLHVTLDKNYPDIQYTLFTVNGKKIINKQFTNKKVFDVETPLSLTNGIYFLQIITSEGTLNKRVVIN